MFGIVVGRQEAQHLELGVDARLEPAERLEDQRVAEDDGGVGLLAEHGAHVDRAARARVRRLRPAERQRALVGADVGGAPHAVQQLAAVRGIRQRVVVGPAVQVRADDPLRPALGGRAEADRHLVDLVPARPEVRLDQGEDEHRRLLPERDRLQHVEVRDLAVLRPEPALFEDPLVQALLGQRGEQAGGVRHRAAPSARPPPAGTSRSRAARA